MKQFLIIFFGLIAGCLSARASSLQKKQDTAPVVVDSLAYYYHDVRNMLILLDEKPVHFSVVFDSIKQKQRESFRKVHGTVFPYEAIKHYGEKYRKGILAYKRESEGNNE